MSSTKRGTTKTVKTTKKSPVKSPVYLKNTLQNFAVNSGATDTYCCGIIVGVVGALVSTGMAWRDAITTAAQNMPVNSRMQAGTSVPESWIGALYAEFMKVRTESMEAHKGPDKEVGNEVGKEGDNEVGNKGDKEGDKG